MTTERGCRVEEGKQGNATIAHTCSSSLAICVSRISNPPFDTVFVLTSSSPQLAELGIQSMLRRNPTRVDPSGDEAERRELLAEARATREAASNKDNHGDSSNEQHVVATSSTKPTTAERIGYRKPS